MLKRLAYVIVLVIACKFFIFCRSRGKIVKSNPLTVFFIDFGNEDKPESENVYPMPQKFLDIPPMVIFVHINYKY